MQLNQIIAKKEIPRNSYWQKIIAKKAEIDF